MRSSGSFLAKRGKLSAVGRTNGVGIYSLEFSGTVTPGETPGPYLRSILIESSPGKVHEVYVQERPFAGTLYRGEIVMIGPPTVIAVLMADGGMYRSISKDYFAISPEGAVLLDFTPVQEAASKVVPAGMRTWPPTSGYDFGSLTFFVATEPADGPAKISCCQGRVEVTFRIEGGRVVASPAKFFPE
jgi:hypothetical protein